MEAVMRVVRSTLFLLSVAVLLASASPGASADVVHLRTGEAVKGRPVQERSTDLVLTIEDYLTGALRRFAWSAVDPEDRERIRTKWGLEETGETTIMGERIEYRLDDGSTADVRGVVESETDTTISLRKDGDIVPVPKSRVVSRDEEELDVRDVYSGEQLMQRQRKSMEEQENVDFGNLTSQEHWRIGSYAEWVGEYEVAKEHFAICAADETFLKKDVAAARLARVEALLQDKAAFETLRDARLKLGLNLFKRAKEILDRFPEQHPEASELVLEKLESLKGEFAERRTSELQNVARRRFVKIVEDLIADKIREKGVAITDVTGWTRRGLPEDAFKLLAEKAMAKYDDVTPEEAKTLWDGRSKRQWRRVTYGGGTFIVDPPKIKPPKRRAGGGGSRGQKKGGGGQVEIPKPPTRDQWWEQASVREREQWVLAYFIENSELFELGEKEYRPCPMCHGVGLLSKTLQTGDVLSYLCTRCGGAQQDVIVKFR